MGGCALVLIECYVSDLHTLSQGYRSIGFIGGKNKSGMKIKKHSPVLNECIIPVIQMSYKHLIIVCYMWYCDGRRGKNIVIQKGARPFSYDYVVWLA